MQLNPSEGFIKMTRRKVTELLTLISFTITVWILCIAYAITSLGD